MYVRLLIPVALIGLLAIGTWLLRVRTRRIAAARPGETIESFRAAFAGSNVSDAVAVAVYAKFQEWCADAVPAFPVRTDDDIGQVYGMIAEDLEDAALEILAECGLVPPDETTARSVDPVTTVGELVRFISGCRQHT